MIDFNPTRDLLQSLTRRIRDLPRGGDDDLEQFGLVRAQRNYIG